VSSDTALLKIDRFREWFQRRSGVQRPVRPVLIVMVLVLAQDPPQMVLIPDEGVVEKLASASPDPAFGDRVHARRPDVAAHDPDPRVGEDRTAKRATLLVTATDEILGTHRPFDSATRAVSRQHSRVLALHQLTGGGGTAAPASRTASAVTG
jgi:hypothetical protein